MATSSSYYINAPSLASATAVYTDADLTICAPSGFYSDGSISRQQIGCVLLPQQACPSCVSYNCVSEECVDPGDGTGEYSSLLACQEVCGIPPTPTCPDRRVVIQICNSNALIDDNFDIYLNDVYIGAVNLNSDAQVGSVFIADTNTSVVLGSSDFACPLPSMVTYHFDPAIVLSVNTLEMRNTQNNENGNFGTVGVRNYSISGTTLSAPCLIADLNYNGSSGESFFFNFNYNQCCPVSYICMDGSCVDPGDGGGTYTSLAECEASCVPVTYNCIAGSCVDPGDGTGTYATLELCLASCSSITYAKYNGEKRACVDCSTVIESVLLAFDDSLTLPTIGLYYAPASGPDGFSYQVISTSTSTDAGLILTTSNSFASCTIQCSA